MTRPIPKTAAELAEEQAREWGTYVATEQIYVDGGLAFNPGDAVPVGHVETLGHVLEHQVAKPSTKTGREQLRGLGLDYPDPAEKTTSGTTPSGAAAGGTDEKTKG